MDTQRRIDIYAAQPRITPRMRRRLIKKAGHDPQATVIRDDGMGYPASRQGFRELIGYTRQAAFPVSGAPVDGGRSYAATDVLPDELY